MRVPTRYAVREMSLLYEDDVQREILNFLGQNLKHDYLNANREINLDLVLNEASYLYNANDRIKGLAETGELKQLHEKCADLDSSVQTNYIKVMDQLDRVLAQI